MKKTILLFSIPFVFILFGFRENKIDEQFNISKFDTFPSKYKNDWTLLFRNVHPRTGYKYWRLISRFDFLDSKRNVTWNQGDIGSYEKDIDNIKPNFGFFLECLPTGCFSYIVAINSKDSIEVIDSEEKLRKFVGDIDNFEEALLISKTYGYWFDEENKLGGAYRFLNGDYYLYLLSYSQRPVTYTSVKAILKQNGDFKKIDSKIYKRTNRYIVE